MRSRAERALHALALGLVGWAWWQSWHSATKPGVEVIAQPGLRHALVRWTLTDPVHPVHIRFAMVPDATSREWLAALATTGSPVTWDAVAAGPLPATAIGVEPVADPRKAVRVAVAAPAHARVGLTDRLGAIDSATVPHGIATFVTSPPVGNISARVAGAIASARVADTVVLRRIYVVGTASWEAKFVIRSLEEEGWGVDAHLLVAPKNDVVPSTPVTLDTAHYAAVVALDSAAAGERARIARYVASGGGLVLEPAAVASLANQAAGGVGGDEPGAAHLPEEAPRNGLTLRPVTNLVSDAVVLERRREMPTVVARRIGAGRVVQIGYSDSWRWRMASGDSAVEAYRAWWTGLVSAVAYAPSIAGTSARVADPAPLVATVEKLGPPRAAAPAGAAHRAGLPWMLLFALVIAALIGEWGSRRMRGVP